jgi:hypothetical protein
MPAVGWKLAWRPDRPQRMKVAQAMAAIECGTSSCIAAPLGCAASSG